MPTPPSPADNQPFPFDDQMRSAYDETATPLPPPSARMWAALQPHLAPPVAPPPPRLPRRAPLLVGVGGLVLGILLMWGGQPEPVRQVAVVGTVAPTIQSLLPTTGSLPPTAGSLLSTSGSLLSTNGSLPSTNESLLSTNESLLSTNESLLSTSESRLSTSGSLPPNNGSLPPTAGSLPLVVQTPTVLVALVLTETTYAAVPADSARPFRERRRAALLTQRAELTRLRWRTDSLLLGLGEGPAPMLATTDSLPPSHPLTLPPSRWSVALSFAPERNFFGFSSPVSDTVTALRRTHEQGRAGYNAALLVEYRATDRLSIGAGLGLTSYGAELRLTDRRTLLTVSYDTALTHTVRTQSHTTSAYAVPLQPHLTPRYNLSGQVIGFDTAWVPSPDTIWTHLTQVLVDSATTRTITPTITKREEVSGRILKPDYRFLTVPVVVRYRLGRVGGTFSGPNANRWWADVALGAQVQLFLGGTQLTSADGRTWRTERVGVGGGPFRPLTVALTGALTLNYALTPQLSASVAPTVRYQTESVYRASTGLTQRPAATGVQLGLRFSF